MVIRDRHTYQKESSCCDSLSLDRLASHEKVWSLTNLSSLDELSEIKKVENTNCNQMNYRESFTAGMCYQNIRREEMFP